MPPKKKGRGRGWPRGRPRKDKSNWTASDVGDCEVVLTHVDKEDEGPTPTKRQRIDSESSDISSLGPLYVGDCVSGKPVYMSSKREEDKPPSQSDIEPTVTSTVTANFDTPHTVKTEVKQEFIETDVIYIQDSDEETESGESERDNIERLWNHGKADRRGHFHCQVCDIVTGNALSLQKHLATPWHSQNLSVYQEATMAQHKQHMKPTVKPVPPMDMNRTTTAQDQDNSLIIVHSSPIKVQTGEFTISKPQAESTGYQSQTLEETSFSTDRGLILIEPSPEKTEFPSGDGVMVEPSAQNTQEAKDPDLFICELCTFKTVFKSVWELHLDCLSHRDNVEKNKRHSQHMENNNQQNHQNVTSESYNLQSPTVSDGMLDINVAQGQQTPVTTPTDIAMPVLSPIKTTRESAVPASIPRLSPMNTSSTLNVTSTSIVPISSTLNVTSTSIVPISSTLNSTSPPKHSPSKSKSFTPTPTPPNFSPMQHLSHMASNPHPQNAPYNAQHQNTTMPPGMHPQYPMMHPYMYGNAMPYAQPHPAHMMPYPHMQSPYMPMGHPARYPSQNVPMHIQPYPMNMAAYHHSPIYQANTTNTHHQSMYRPR